MSSRNFELVEIPPEMPEIGPVLTILSIVGFLLVGVPVTLACKLAHPRDYDLRDLPSIVWGLIRSRQVSRSNGKKENEIGPRPLFRPKPPVANRLK